jgi:3-hydroxy-D-aspartate aldolase
MFCPASVAEPGAAPSEAGVWLGIPRRLISSIGGNFAQSLIFVVPTAHTRFPTERLPPVTQSLVGSHKLDLDTPALCIDLDIMEANIGKMMAHMAARGKQWRPHVKCHKTPAISWKQIRAGAIGVTCAKVSEAEVFAHAGIRDILIANMIVGERKLHRVAALCRDAEPIVACDHYAQAEMLSQVCIRHGVRCRTIIEIDIGLERVGIKPGHDTLELAQGMDRLPGIELVGIMGYEGHLLQVEDQAEKRMKIFDAMEILGQTRDAMQKSGLNCEIVSAGGTGSYQITSDVACVTELQAGGGIFAEPFYQQRCHVEGLESAVTVLATVASRPVLGRAILDVGRKTIHPDFVLPQVKGISGADVLALSAEHCKVQLSGDARDLKIGDKLELYPGYNDFTTILHENFYGFRGDRLELVWPILARGKLQ